MFEEVLDAEGQLARLCEPLLPFLKRVGAQCRQCQEPKPLRESLLKNSVQQVPDGSGAILGLLQGIRMLELSVIILILQSCRAALLTWLGFVRSSVFYGVFVLCFSLRPPPSWGNPTGVQGMSPALALVFRQSPGFSHEKVEFGSTGSTRKCGPAAQGRVQSLSPQGFEAVWMWHLGTGPWWPWQCWGGRGSAGVVALGALRALFHPE